MSNTNTKTVRVNCGDTAIVPSGAKNIKVIKNGTITLTSECLDLSNETTLSCYSVVFAESNASGGIQVFDDMWITGIRFDGVEYTFGSNIDLSIVGFPGTPTTSPSADDFVKTIINTLPTLDGLLVQPCSSFKSDSDRGDAYAYIFKTTSDIASKLQIIVEGQDIGASGGKFKFYAPVLSIDSQPAFLGNWNPICGCKTS